MPRDPTSAIFAMTGFPTATTFQRLNGDGISGEAFTDDWLSNLNGTDKAVVSETWRGEC